MAPPNSSSFSFSVVLPASGWEMIANVRRRATSLASGEPEGDSAVRAMSDMGRAFGRETAPDQGDSRGLRNQPAGPISPFGRTASPQPKFTRGDDPAFIGRA